MKRFLVVMSVVFVAFACSARADETADSTSESVATSTSQPEAQARAKILHEMVRGTLQVMHRDFFDEDNAHAIPSASLEDVFHELRRAYDVEMKWLIVNTDVVNVDHKPETKFEKVAAKQLADGKPFVEQVTADRYQFAGPIRLGSQCLKCHVKRRTSNEDRTAGLVITMPVATASAAD